MNRLDDPQFIEQTVSDAVIALTDLVIKHDLTHIELAAIVFMAQAIGASK